MATFKSVKNDGQIDAYVCKENPAIRIEVSRGSFSTIDQPGTTFIIMVNLSIGFLLLENARKW